MIQRDLGLRFNTNGSFNFNKNWLKNLKYTVSANYTNKKTYREEFATNSDWTYSTSKPTEPFFRACPDRIFTWPTVRKSRTSPMPTRTAKPGACRRTIRPYTTCTARSSTPSRSCRPISAGDLGRTHHRLIIGGEYRATGNLGEGKVFDPETPPRRSVNTNFTTQRERAFSDVPFMHQFSLFAEEYFSMDILRRKLEIVARRPL